MPHASAVAAPVRSRRIDKRQLILDAAAELFGDLGYERTSVDAIAMRSGVSKPTIYSHFGTKEGLFRESLAASAATVHGDLMAAIADLDVGSDSWRAGLVELGVSIITCRQSPCAQSVQRQIYAEVRRDPGVFDAVKSSAVEPVVEALAGKLARLANAGRLGLDDPVLAAKQLLALMDTELAEMSGLGMRVAGAAEVRRSATAAVRLFLAAYATAG